MLKTLLKIARKSRFAPASWKFLELLEINSSRQRLGHIFTRSLENGGEKIFTKLLEETYSRQRLENILREVLEHKCSLAPVL